MLSDQNNIEFLIILFTKSNLTRVLPDWEGEMREGGREVREHVTSQRGRELVTCHRRKERRERERESLLLLVIWCY